MLYVFILHNVSEVFVSWPLQSVIFYAVQSPKLNHWLNSDNIQEQLQALQDPQYVDVDPTFYHNIDEDYDLRQGGISKVSFLNCYLAWIQYCASRKDPVSKPLASYADVVWVCHATREVERACVMSQKDVWLLCEL